MLEETIGARIAKLRNEFSYSQEYVAEKLGVSRQAVSKWEQNQSSPDTNNLIALAELFNVSVEYLAIGKTQEGKEKAKEKDKTPAQAVQKNIGYILLGTGLLSLILGFIFTEILIIISVYLIASGIMLFIIKNNLPIILTGVLLSITLVLSCFLTKGSALGSIFLLALAIVIIVCLLKIYNNKNSAE